MRKIILVVGTLLMMASMLLAQATPMHRNHVSNKPGEQFNPSLKQRPGMMNGMMECMDELKLSEEQKGKLETLHSAFEKNRNTVQAEIENIQIDIQAAMKAENYTKAKDLTKQLNNKQTELQQAHIDFQADRMKELNKEQKEILKKSMPMMMGHGGFPRGNGMHGKRGMMMQNKQMHMSGEGCGNCTEHQNSGQGQHLNPDCKAHQEQMK